MQPTETTRVVPAREMTVGTIYWRDGVRFVVRDVAPPAPGPGVLMSTHWCFRVEPVNAEGRPLAEERQVWFPGAENVRVAVSA